MTTVITGASAGVGRATARAFAERGAALGLIARGQEGLDATLPESCRARIDAYLGIKGYELQQGEEAVDGQRPDNLFEPLSGDLGAHGRFDADSRATSRLLDVRLCVGNVVDAVRRVSARRRPARRPALRGS